MWSGTSKVKAKCPVIKVVSRPMQLGGGGWENDAQAVSNCGGWRISFADKRAISQSDGRVGLLAFNFTLQHLVCIDNNVSHEVLSHVCNSHSVSHITTQSWVERQFTHPPNTATHQAW